VTDETEVERAKRENDTARAHLASLLAVLDDKGNRLAGDVRALMVSAAREFLAK
jgi:hypothetical protein